jgi:serine protease Do
VPAVVHISIGVPTRKPPPLGDNADASALVAPAHGGPRLAGSGTIIDRDGYILSVAHLFDAPDPVTVRTSDGREFPARVVGRDRRTDVALLKIEGTGLPIVAAGDPQKLRLGERVFAVGALPGGTLANVTDGIVSVLGPRQEGVPGFLQTTVPLYPAMGGGPLFNQRGEMIGINARVLSRSSGLGLSFAIRADDAFAVAAELRAQGRVRRASLGVMLQDLSSEGGGAGAPAGVLVREVTKGSPAERAGIAAGDVIVRLGRDTVRGSADVVRVVGSSKPGAHVLIQLRRAKSARIEEVEAILAEAQD